MPLLIDRKPVTLPVTDVEQLVTQFPSIKEPATCLRDMPVKEVGPQRFLYVSQKEYAVLCPDDAFIDTIGSDDATTCHILVLRHSGSGVTGITHCDGSATQRLIDGLVNDIVQFSHGKPDGRLEVHMAGGFIDDKKESIKVTQDVFDCFKKRPEEIHLVTACITDLNDVIRDGLHFPSVYGLAVNVKTGDVYKACILDKGPDEDIRSAAIFTGAKKSSIDNMYDRDTGHLIIGPYPWQPWPDVHLYLQLPDVHIRKYLSTSPDQEPAHFETHTREALTVILNHPEPMKTLFKDNKARRYKLQNDDTWVPVDS